MKVAVVGGYGRVGSVVVDHLRSKGIDVEPFGSSDDVSKLREYDVVVEFTNPKATKEHTLFLLKHPKPYVVGTTALDDENIELLRKLSEKVPVLLSYNFSYGINLILRILKQFKENLSVYDASLIEIHHRYKKDSPSGTAKLLSEAIGNLRDIHALRIGGVFGEHKIVFASEGEVLEITHRALSRKVFAEGVFRAINFILGKDKGFYTMEDVV